MGWTRERARLAALHRHRRPDDPEITSTVRDLAAERIAEYVRQTVAAAPPLTPAQRQKITALLRPTGGDAG